MKRIIALTMCALTLVGASAQKANVDQAKKLAGKLDKVEDARGLIRQAIANPETSNLAETYFIAGKIEWDAFDKNKEKQMVNPQNVNAVEMGNELLNGYNYFMQVFPLDLLPNEKGEIKPKFTKDVQKKIAANHSDFWNSGAVFYGEKMYYPEAYNAFMIYGDLPELAELGNQRPQVPDTTRAIAYFNAGISAWGADRLDDAAVAFRKARLNNYTDPQAAIYEIACWQNIEMKDSTRESEARDKIYEAAKGGYEKFGMEQPVFLNNMVNALINDGKEQEALDLINGALQTNPDNANLYGLRAFVYDRMNNHEASEADYRNAASLPDVTYDTMRLAVTKLLRTGQEKWNEIELGDPDMRAKKEAIKENYFKAAKDFAEKAKTLTDDPSDMDYLMESIDYQLGL